MQILNLGSFTLIFQWPSA